MSLLSRELCLDYEAIGQALTEIVAHHSGWPTKFRSSGASSKPTNEANGPVVLDLPHDLLLFGMGKSFSTLHHRRPYPNLLVQVLLLAENPTHDFGSGNVVRRFCIIPELD